jgi:adenosylmethionine-8-amino-7-oxononanoate aminotransferase
MPPLIITTQELTHMLNIVYQAICQVTEGKA